MVSAKQWLGKMATKAAANGRFLDSGSGHLHFYPLRISSSDGGWKVTGRLVSHRPGAGSGTWAPALSLQCRDLHLLPQCDTWPRAAVRVP